MSWLIAAYAAVVLGVGAYIARLMWLRRDVRPQTETRKSIRKL